MLKTAAYKHGGGDVGQQIWIQRWRRCGTAKEEIWDDGDGKMGWKDGYVLRKYLQVTTTNLRVYRCSDNLGLGATTDLHGSLGCIWRLCISYCNLNKLPADSITHIGASIISSFTLERPDTA